VDHVCKEAKARLSEDENFELTLEAGAPGKSPFLTAGVFFIADASLALDAGGGAGCPMLVVNQERDSLSSGASWVF